MTGQKKGMVIRGIFSTILPKITIGAVENTHIVPIFLFMPQLWQYFYTLKNTGRGRSPRYRSRRHDRSIPFFWPVIIYLL